MNGVAEEREVLTGHAACSSAGRQTISEWPQIIAPIVSFVVTGTDYAHTGWRVRVRCRPVVHTSTERMAVAHEANRGRRTVGGATDVANML